MGHPNFVPKEMRDYPLLPSAYLIFAFICFISFILLLFQFQAFTILLQLLHIMLCNAKAYKQTNKHNTPAFKGMETWMQAMVRWGELLNLYDPHFFFFCKIVIIMPIVKFIKGTLMS